MQVAHIDNGLQLEMDLTSSNSRNPVISSVIMVYRYG